MPRIVDVFPPLDGAVMLHNVEDGARVAAGDRLMEIECMKTLWPVEAPAAGIVRIIAGLGQVVGTDQPVATIETGDQ